tara:strand:+ start:439 stop:1407 length:969 start_codon:yes stop_codon:yes gene_type:complete
MKVYCVKYSAHAGKWIYDGYRSAWQDRGFHLHEMDKEKEDYILQSGHMGYCSEYPITESDLSEEYIIMTTADIICSKPESWKAVERSHKTFVFVQPKTFPEPWGRHPNFYCAAPDEGVRALNDMDNVVLWTFAKTTPEFYHQWDKKIHTIPLAFDSINYKPQTVEKYKQFDISFVGGWANNGFDEKRKIIINIFSKFKDSGLKCGFFINKNLTRQQECDLLANSKMTLNIHDAYQRVLGLDTNERTFKSLGLNGLMISDTVKHLNEIFPDVRTSIDPQELVNITKEILSLTQSEIDVIKEKNKQEIIDNHCYVNRIDQLMSL